MVSQDTLLVTLVKLVDRVPMPTLPTKQGWGHPIVYPDHLLLKAVVIMIARHLHNLHELLRIIGTYTKSRMSQLYLGFDMTKGTHFSVRDISNAI